MKQLYTYLKSHLLSGLAITVGETVLDPYSEHEAVDGAVCTYASAGDIRSLALTARFTEEAVVLELDAVCDSGFAAQNALSLSLGDLQPDGMLSSRHDGPWWMYPEFVTDFAELKPKTQFVLLRGGALHYCLLPLCAGNFRAEFEAGKLLISSGMTGMTHLHGPVLAVSVSTDPYEAVKNAYSGAAAVGGITVPLVGERRCPDVFDGFGWCTWDAFYNDVSSALIYEKLAEFREKGIRIRWMIIDAGWMQKNDRTLNGLEVNDHFPQGLAAAVTKIKEEYGVEQVGIWHTLGAFWNGITPDSELAAALGDAVFTTANGIVLPALEPARAHLFWDRWYSYLKACGIDFVKVDNQSSHSAHLEETMPTAEGCRLAHQALENAVDKYFGGVIINCMGMDMENVLARPRSAVSRNSDDFYPERERGFIKHIMQNVYNAVWHSQLYVCDYDMWWSDHPESAVQSGVLRAISGSPIYVSDKIGQSNAANILPLTEDDGRIMRCDLAAQPTSDCLYTDPTSAHRLLKIWNRAGDAFAVAAFNVSEDSVTDVLDFGTIPGLSGDCGYLAYEYFSRTWSRVNAYEDITVTLGRDGVAVWSLYPIEETDEGEFVTVGDTSKYVPIASRHKTRVSAASLLGEDA